MYVHVHVHVYVQSNYCYVETKSIQLCVHVHVAHIYVSDDNRLSVSVEDVLTLGVSIENHGSSPLCVWQAGIDALYENNRQEGVNPTLNHTKITFSLCTCAHSKVRYTILKHLGIHVCTGLLGEKVADKKMN